MMRIRGLLTPASEEKRLDNEDMISIAAAVLPTGHRENFKENREVDLAYSVAGLGRFRCNTFQQRGTIGHREKFKENREVDLAYSVAGLGRFRCNTFQQRGTIGMIFRVIPMKIATIER